MIEVKVPGKIYIAGEYAVVKEGHSAVLISVNKFIKVKISKSNSRGSVKSFSNLKMIWKRVGDNIIVEQQDDRFIYIITAMNTVEQYLREKGVELDVYDIEVESDLESKDGIKYGLGSSAAIIVAITKGLLKYYGIHLSNLEIFKLCVLSNIKLSSSGSCGDIASAVYTGIIKYTSFSRWDILKYAETYSISELINMKWKELNIERIEKNPEFDFLVAWTKSPASSQNLVKSSKKLVNSNEEFYKYFLEKSNHIVDSFIRSYRKSDFDEIKVQIASNRELLLKYADNYNIEIETDKLKRIIETSIELGIASKTSGAGGGDCAFAITPLSRKNEIEKKWDFLGIPKLNLEIYEEKDAK